MDRFIKPLNEFLRLTSSGGLLLMAAATLAILVANSPLADGYATLLATPFEIRFGATGLAKPLHLWINDGLMALFFLLVGLELKREVVEGHLSDLRTASLPAFAAVGGMAAPALIYIALNSGDAVAMQGWAIPAATDIAFALGVLSLLGSRVPTALKAFLLSVAIFDDLGAIIVIAIFYTAQLSLTSLAVAGGLISGLFLLNRFGVTRIAAYLLLGVPLWLAVLKSGVHATLAGVVVALFIPIQGSVVGLTEGARTPSPLRKLEHALHPWVAFGVLPIFAFSNAGVSLSGLSPSDVLRPVPLGVIAGLFVGKQVGVFGLSWLAVRFGLARRPRDVSWRQIHGAALLAGIGFTMSLFVASLAFEEGAGIGPGLERLGVVVGSLLSGVVGYFILQRALPKAGVAVNDQDEAAEADGTV